MNCDAICRSATARRKASSLVSLSRLPLQCGVRLVALGRPANTIRRAPLRPSLWRNMLPAFISISVSPTSRSSPPLRRNDAAASDTWWAGIVAGTT